MRNSELSHLHEALEEMDREGKFVPLASGFLKVLAERGIRPDRLQVPMSKTLGFRHPTLWGVLLTWTNANGFADTALISHALASERGMPTDDLSSDPKELPLSVSPFVYLHKSGDWFLQLDLVESDLGYDLLRSLRDEGVMPRGMRQNLHALIRRLEPHNSERVCACGSTLRTTASG